MVEGRAALAPVAVPVQAELEDRAGGLVAMLVILLEVWVQQDKETMERRDKTDRYPAVAAAPVQPRQIRTVARVSQAISLARLCIMRVAAVAVRNCSPEAAPQVPVDLEAAGLAILEVEAMARMDTTA